MLQIAFPLIDSRCHGSKIWDKIGFSSPCVKDICNIFAPIEGCLRMGHQMPLITFLPTAPRFHGNKIGTKAL